MKIKHMLGLLCSMPFLLNAQVPVPTDFTWHVKRTEDVVTYFEVQEGAKLTNLDKAQLQPSSMNMTVDKYFDNTLNMPFKIVKTNETSGLFDEFMKKPETIVIDKNGTYAYSNKGRLTKSIPHSREYKRMAIRHSTTVFPSFVSNSISHVTMAPGQTIKQDIDGTITIKGNQTWVSINPKNYTKQVVKLKPNGKIQSTQTTRYAPVISVRPDYPSADDVIVLYDELITEYILPSGACTKSVKRTTYSDYIIENNESIQSRNNSDLLDHAINIYPNPADDILNLEGLPTSPCIVTIYNSSGKVEMKVTTQGNQKLDISSLIKGIYFLEANGQEIQFNSKFVKL